METRSVFSNHRKAIAMIELIFAIVVMGLALMTAPLLIQRSVSDTFLTYQQESIAAAVTQIQSVMTRAWDQNNVDQTTVGEPILQTNNGLVLCPAGQSYPPGVTSTSGRYCVSQVDNVTRLNASAIGLDADNVLNDIDDFDRNVSTLSLFNNESYRVFEGDYLDLNISMRTTVAYGDDTPHTTNGNPNPNAYDNATFWFSNPFSYQAANPPSNIKLINVTLTSNNPVAELADKRILLGSFMCNIGAPRNFVSNKGSL